MKALWHIRSPLSTLRAWGQYRSPAFAGTISSGTWIIASVAMATILTAAAAVPGSPVRHWIGQSIHRITCIGSTTTACVTSSGGSSGSSSNGALTPAATTVPWTLTTIAASASGSMSQPLTVGLPLGFTVFGTPQTQGSLPLGFTVFGTPQTQGSLPLGFTVFGASQTQGSLNLTLVVKNS